MKKYTRIFLIAQNWKLSKMPVDSVLIQWTLHSNENEWVLYPYTKGEPHGDNSERKKTEAKSYDSKPVREAGKADLPC